MVRLTLIARMRDGLPLAEGLDADKEHEMYSYKSQAKVGGGGGGTAACVRGGLAVGRRCRPQAARPTVPEPLCPAAGHLQEDGGQQQQAAAAHEH